MERRLWGLGTGVEQVPFICRGYWSYTEQNAPPWSPRVKTRAPDKGFGQPLNQSVNNQTDRHKELVIEVLLARWAPQPLKDGSILPSQPSSSKIKAGVTTAG